jgi:hypothetical protein
MTTDGWTLALLTSTAVHAGFQATVTALVYPTLVRVPADDWARAHDQHSRRIVPVVATVYGATLVSCAGSLAASPASWPVRVAALGTGVAMVVTAVAAAPTHGRLGRGRTDALASHLLRVDRLRLAGTLVALAGAVAAARPR